jgi:hypothetical protein
MYPSLSVFHYSIVPLLRDASMRNDACRYEVGMTHVIYSRRLHFGQTTRARALRVDN